MTDIFLKSSPKEDTERKKRQVWNRRRAASDFLLLEDTSGVDVAPPVRDGFFKTRRASVSESTLERSLFVSSRRKNSNYLLPLSPKKFELPYYAPRTSSPKSLYEQVGLIRRSAKMCKEYISKMFRRPREKKKVETGSFEDSVRLSQQDHSWSQPTFSSVQDNELLNNETFCFQQSSSQVERAEVVGTGEWIQAPQTDYSSISTVKSESEEVARPCSDKRNFMASLLRTLSIVTGQEVTRNVVSKVLMESVLSMLPLIVWFLVFNFYPRLSLSWRPAINTSLLPKLEGLLHFPYRWFATRSSKAADFVAAIPYTIHAVLPGMFFLYLLLTEGRKSAFCFFASLGVLNTSAVLTQILFPFAPPWYFELNGLAKAEHWMSGNPGAALSRVDKFFGIVFYQETYTTQNRIPFGSFPSLHAAWPSLIAFCFPARGSHLFKVLASCYVCLIYWAAMYLQHHYVIDLLGGTLYAYLTYRMVFSRKLDISSLFYRVDSEEGREKGLVNSSGSRPVPQPICNSKVISFTNDQSPLSQRRSLIS
jgi:hypothetical protein